jgi:hypothetical protein
MLRKLDRALRDHRRTLVDLTESTGQARCLVESGAVLDADPNPARSAGRH